MNALTCGQNVRFHTYPYATYCGGCWIGNLVHMGAFINHESTFCWVQFGSMSTAAARIRGSKMPGTSAVVASCCSTHRTQNCYTDIYPTGSKAFSTRRKGHRYERNKDATNGAPGIATNGAFLLLVFQDPWPCACRFRRLLSMLRVCPHRAQLDQDPSPRPTRS